MKPCVPAVCVALFLTLVFVGSDHLSAQKMSTAPKLFAPGVISGAANEISPAFSPDGKTVYFSRGNDSGSMILVSHFAKGQWSAPVIAPFSGKWNDLEPAMAPDGSFLVFASNRPLEGEGKPLDGKWDGKVFLGLGGNLWRVDRQGAEWGRPKRLPDTINADTGTFSPSIASDGSIYFMRPAKTNGHFALYRSQCQSGIYEEASPVAVGSASTEDVDPAVSPNERFIVYSSNRPDLHDKKRLLIAFRNKGQWETPIDLGDDVNENGNNIESRLGSDHTTLFFSTNTVPPSAFPRIQKDAQDALEQMNVWANGSENIWYVPLEQWLVNRAKHWEHIEQNK